MPEPTETAEPATDVTPQPEPLHQRVWDAITWGLSLVISNIANIPHTWRNASPRERTRLIVSVCFVLAALAVAGKLGQVWGWLLAAALIANVVADLDDINQDIAERRKTLRLLETTPTGAPRVANIRCGRDVTHRFIYGPGGWEEAGPAQHPADA